MRRCKQARGEIWRHDHVGIEEDDVAVGDLAKGTIDRTYKPTISFVSYQGDQAAVSEDVKHLCNRRFRCSVVDGDDFYPVRQRCRRENAVEAGFRCSEIGVNRNDYGQRQILGRSCVGRPDGLMDASNEPAPGDETWQPRRSSTTSLAPSGQSNKKEAAWPMTVASGCRGSDCRRMSLDFSSHRSRRVGLVSGRQAAQPLMRVPRTAAEA